MPSSKAKEVRHQSRCDTERWFLTLISLQGGLQSASQTAGEMIADNSDMRGKQSKKSDSASESLGQFAKGDIAVQLARF